MPRLPDNVYFTMLPNFLIDEMLDGLSYGEMKVLLVIYRKTLGYDKKTDEIAYSQFIQIANLSKSTIPNAIDSLAAKNLITVDKSGVTNRYGYILPEDDDCPNLEPPGSINEQDDVQNLNSSPVRKSNTQKKPIKENKRNTTNSSSDLSEEARKAIKYWDEIFPNTLKLPNSDLKRHIENSVSQFSVKEIKEAIFRRSNNNYYRNKKPQLIDKPNAFFPYPETIRNDLNRKTDTIFTYDEKNERIFNKQNIENDFKIMRERKDNKGRPLWKLKDASCMITVSNI